MKRIFCIFITVFLMLSIAFAMTSCGSGTDVDGGSESDKTEVGELKHDDSVKAALNLVSAAWEEHYKNYAPNGNKVIKIVNTSVVEINHNADFSKQAQEAYNEYLSEINLIVKFIILSDYYGTGGEYLQNAYQLCEVAFYNDGSAEIVPDILNRIGSLTYDYNYSVYIKSYCDYASSYDRTVWFD